MNTVQEKKKIKLFKALSILLFIGSIVFTVFMSIGGYAEFKDYDGSYYYDSATNKSNCSITLEFYEPVVGEFTILLYDANDNLIYEMQSFDVVEIDINEVFTTRFENGFSLKNLVYKKSMDAHFVAFDLKNYR